VRGAPRFSFFLEPVHRNSRFGTIGSRPLPFFFFFFGSKDHVSSGKSRLEENEILTQKKERFLENRLGAPVLFFSVPQCTGSSFGAGSNPYSNVTFGQKTFIHFCAVLGWQNTMRLSINSRWMLMDAKDARQREEHSSSSTR